MNADGIFYVRTFATCCGFIILYRKKYLCDTINDCYIFIYIPILQDLITII